jgi:futalosine hydrolase
MKPDDEFCSMPVLITAATDFELGQPLKNTINADVLVTGAGVPAVMFHLQKKLQQKKYNCVVQAGIAGAFENSFALGKVVLVKQDTFGDLGMERENVFTSIFDSGLADKNAFPFKDGWLVNTHVLLQQANLAKVKAVTVNKVTDSKTHQQQLAQNFSPAIETMEGAALHYVCLQENIPFLQIRAISNYVGERDKQKWKMKEAIESLNIELNKLMQALHQAQP